MGKKVVYSATTAAIYSVLFYILIESPDGVGFLNSPILTFSFKSILQLAILYPFVSYILFMGLIFIGSFATPILKILHLDIGEIGQAAMIHIPVAVLLGILTMEFGIKIIGGLVI